jgi:endonuclease/exonuclease/phosphatase family metal-dependent hydrolase
MSGALALLLLAACGLDTGPPAEWTATSTIDGDLAAEQEPPPSPPSVPATSGQVLRVVTYNVHLGGEPELMAAEIRANPALAAADVFLLQEQESYPTESATRARRLATLLELGWIYVPGRRQGDGTHGLAIMSRFPIEDAAIMVLPATEDWKRRIAIRADIVVGTLRIPVVDVHLETRINITDRILQLRPAVLDLPPDVIVAGDFNTNPFLWEEGEVPILPTAQIVDTDQAPILDDYMRGLGFATPAAGVGPTQRQYGVDSRLDAIFARGFAASTAQVERGLTASDHWPVWVDLTLP